MERPSRPTHEGDPGLRTTEFLVEKARQGSQDAFTQLYELHHDAVGRSVARRIGCRLGDLVDIDDILQETFLASWQYLEADGFRDFRTVGGFRNFLVKIAIQKVQDEARRLGAARRDRARTEPLPEDDAVSSPAPRPSEMARERELEEIGEVALLRLEEGLRWLIDARENLRMDWAEMARELGCKPANAKLKYSRARDRWRAIARGLCGEGSA